MVTRRAVLTTGTASILVLGAAAHQMTNAESNATFRAPWEEAAKGFGDVRLNALAYAILAPNPHNRQPWKVMLHDDGFSCTLYCDLQRLLPETDPQNRQITIGLGAFLELYKLAAAKQGYGVNINSFPEGENAIGLDERPIATFTLEQNTAIDQNPLFDHVLSRRTIRSKFDLDRSPSEEDLAQLIETAEITKVVQFASTTNTEQIGRLKDVCKRGWKVETSTLKTHHESTALTRIGSKEVSENPDGISLLGPLFEVTRSLGILSRDKMNQPGSIAADGAVSFYNTLIDSAAVFGWISTPTNTRRDQLDAGAAWVRLNLAATKLGIAMHPLSQVLQEFPEMGNLYNEFHDEVKITTPARVQGLFRFGFAGAPKAAPRWPLASRLTGSTT